MNDMKNSKLPNGDAERQNYSPLIMENDDSSKLYDPPVTNVVKVTIHSSILNVSTVSTSLNPMDNGDNLSEGW